MFSELDASAHRYNFLFYEEDFKKLLSNIFFCYKKMLKDRVQLENDENKIRDKLLIDYLNNNKIREEYKDLLDFIFNREVPEHCTVGRTDIKIETKNTFEDTDAYYIIECKRLNNKNLRGKAGLNAKYVKDGIERFVTRLYSSYCSVNGMIGFVVEAMNIRNYLPLPPKKS